MKKSNANKRGGARPGAGRKLKPRAPAIPLRVTAGDATAQELAKAYLALAIETLASVAGAGASEAARVAAARVIIEIATGRAKAAAQTENQTEEPDGWGELLAPRTAGRAN